MFDVRCLNVNVKFPTPTFKHQRSGIRSIAESKPCPSRRRNPGVGLGRFSMVWTADFRLRPGAFERLFFSKRLLTAILSLAVFLSVFLGLSVAAELSFEEAASLYQQSEWKQAASAFAACAEAHSHGERYVAAHFYQGECLMQLEDFSKAREHYRIVLKQPGPYAQRALFRAGESAWLAKDIPSAKPLLQEFARKYPHDALSAYALTYLGEIALLEGDADRSIAAYRSVIESFSHTPQVNKARLGLAKALLAIGKTEDVPLALGRLTNEANSATAAAALMLLGQSEYKAGNYDEALQTFRRIAQSYPEGQLASQAKLAAGWSLWKQGRFDEIAVEIAPLADEPQWTVEEHYLIGMAKYGQDDWPGAIEQLTLALEGPENHPGRDAILFYLGENCLRDGNAEAAAAWFRRLSQHHPQSNWADDALWGVARVAHMEHEVDEFQEAIDQLQSRFPSSRYLDRLKQLQTGEEDYLALPYENELLDEAAGLQRDGRFDAALAAFHELLKQNQIGRTHSEALRLAAKLHHQLAQFPEAKQLFEQFLSQYPDSVHAAEVIDEQAWIGVETGNLDAAATKFQFLYEKFPQSAQALEAVYWLATAAADKEDGELAASYVDWLLTRLSKKAAGEPKTLWEKTLLLKCQLAAKAQQWQEIKDLLAEEGENFDEGPRKARARFWLAEAEFRVGQPNDALALFDLLAGQIKELEESWVAMVPLRRAQLRSRRQQWTDVLKILEEVGKKNAKASFPLQYEVDYLRGRAHAGLGEMTLARRDYQQVLSSAAAKNTTTATMAQWMTGETFFHQNDYPRARLAYRKVIDEHTQPEWQARAALQAGKCWELEQNWEQARSVYATALEQWQDSDSAVQLQARLEWADSQATQRR